MTEKKCLWIINQYASTPATGMGGRHFYLAREMARQGYTVYVIAASFTHLLRAPPVLNAPYATEVVEGINYIWIRMPQYSESHSKARIINWFLFSWRLRNLERVITDRPDAVLCSSPSLVSFLGARRLSRRLGARLIFEVRDIWPLTLMELGGYKKSHPFIRLLQWIEDIAYRQSDSVISSLPNAVEHMVSRGMDLTKFSSVPNGFLEEEVSRPTAVSPAVLAQIPDGKFVVGYTGTFGLANALSSLIEAANYLREYRDIVIVLIGSGKEKRQLQEVVKRRNLGNVIFIASIPKSEIQSVLAKFDACYIGWKRDSLYKFGISPNKLPEYLYSGKPIIHSYSGFGDVVAECRAGITVPAEDPAAIAAAIIELSATSKIQLNAMGRRGRCYALNHYEYGLLAKKLAGIVFSIEIGSE